MSGSLVENLCRGLSRFSANDRDYFITDWVDNRD